MKTSTSSSTTISAATVASLLFKLAAATSSCNPIQTGSCTPTDPGLGSSISVDFTKGENSAFTVVGNSTPIAFTSDGGAQLTVSKSGEAPTLVSNFYIMFGKMDIVMQVAPGVGMASSAILYSDDEDEIDWEMLGAFNTQAQMNYYGQGNDSTHDRVQYTTQSSPLTTSFNTFSVDWNMERIIWSINGVQTNTKAVTSTSDPGYPYPQTPMQVKLGSWACGDPSPNPYDNNQPYDQQGTIEWCTGSASTTISYPAGGYTMQVKSITVQDYSTATQYKYPTNFNGEYQSLVVSGGAINADGTGSGSSSSSTSSTSSSSSSSSSGSASQSSTLSLSHSTSAPYTNNTTSTKASTSVATAATTSSSKSFSPLTMSTTAAGFPAAGGISDVTSIMLVTTAEAVGTGSLKSTVTQVVAPSATGAAASGSTTSQGSASTTSSTSLAAQTGNAAVRLDMANAAAVMGVAAGLAAYMM